MKYLSANNILPKEIVEFIQQYIDGEYIYIPRKDGVKKAWGENSGIRENLYDRNRRIFDEYQSGVTVAALAQEHFLSEQSIRRVICQEKKRRSNSIQSCL